MLLLCLLLLGLLLEGLNLGFEDLGLRCFDLILSIRLGLCFCSGLRLSNRYLVLLLVLFDLLLQGLALLLAEDQFGFELSV